MSLTPEQQAALDELFRAVSPAQPSSPVKTGPTNGTAEGAAYGAAQPSDWLATWFGVSKDDVKAGWELLRQTKVGYQNKLIDWVNNNPIDATMEFIGFASWAFYQAEKDVNPKIETFIDAFYYISTCASVGYADIFALTQTGRSIASLVMLVGPAMTQKTLEYPKRS